MQYFCLTYINYTLKDFFFNLNSNFVIKHKCSTIAQFYIKCILSLYLAHIKYN